MMLEVFCGIGRDRVLRAWRDEAFFKARDNAQNKRDFYSRDMWSSCAGGVTIADGKWWRHHHLKFEIIRPATECCNVGAFYK
jgi:hypothetical protein